MKILILGVFAFLTAFGTVSYASNTLAPGKKNVIILLGAPGSGKGTQAKMLSQKLKLPHISTGDLFRDNLKNGTPLGHKVKGYLESGNLVPDETVIEMLMDRVNADDCKKGYILDGFPRSLPQAEALKQELLKEDINLIVLNIAVDDALIVKRIEGRRSCAECGAIFNIHFSPSKEEGVCDKCGGKLQQRSDDNAQVVEERLRVYHKQTKPLEDYYIKAGVLTNVNGEKDPEQVFNELMEIIKNDR